MNTFSISQPWYYNLYLLLFQTQGFSSIVCFHFTSPRLSIPISNGRFQRKYEKRSKEKGNQGNKDNQTIPLIRGRFSDMSCCSFLKRLPLSFGSHSLFTHSHSLTHTHSHRFAFSYCKIVKERPAFRNGTFRHPHRPTEAPPLPEKPKRLALNPKFIA